MQPEHHIPISGEELGQVFEEASPEVNLSVYAFEDWLTLAIFWMMTACVIAQFFTRYVLNNSLAWTEEIATYCLVGVVFMGSIMCVRLSRHIQVDFLYRYLPYGWGRLCSTLVDILRILFFIYATKLVWTYSSLISEERMTTVDLPKSIVFNTVLFAFAMMAVRSIQVAWVNWKRSYSVLEQPGRFDGSEM